MTRRPRALTTLVVTGAALTSLSTLAACGDQPQKAAPSLRDRVTVDGTFAAKPSIKVDAPLSLDTTSSWVLRQGSGGATVGEGATAILQLTIADGRTGKTAISTFDPGQRPLSVELGDQVFPSLAQALTGKQSGSRVVVASTGKDAYGPQGSPQVGIKPGDPVVMVADILSADPTSLASGPSGASSPVPRGLPSIEEEKGVPTRLSFGAGRKPRAFRAVVLREGTGRTVEDPDRVAVKYLGQVWGADQPFEETYSTKPTTVSIGLGSVIKAWDRALVGLKEGSRVMIVCPPSTAYGSRAQGKIPAGSTLVFVVDVLGVG